MGMRLRLRFDAACGLADDPRSYGVLQWWFAVPPAMSTIADVASGIVSFFRLQQSCPNGVLLLMDDFALPPMESACLLNDKDLVSVKPIGMPMKPSVQWGHLTKAQVDVVKELRALEEFEKESGGYKSESEDLVANVSNSTEFSLQDIRRPVLKKYLVEPSPRTLKRKKSTEDGRRKNKKIKTRNLAQRPDGKLKDGTVSNKKKKQQQKEDSEQSEEECGKHAQKLAEKTKEQDDSDESEQSEDEECRATTEKLNEKALIRKQDVVEKTEEEQGPKRVSRSARRKKAKRAWAKANKNATTDHGNPGLSANQKEITTKPTRDDTHQHQSVTVAPGHIRFGPLDSDEEITIARNVATPALNFASGLKSKKQGQNWGQQKRSGRQECAQNENALENGNVENEDKRMQENEKVNIDFNTYPYLQGTPKKGDILAYKLLELSSNLTPEVSSFRVGKVISFDVVSKLIKLAPVANYPIEKINEEYPDSYQEDGSLEVDFPSLLDVHVVEYADNNDINAEISINEANGSSTKSKEKTNDSERAHINGDIPGKMPANMPLSKADRWHLKSMRAAALGPTLARLRAQNSDAISFSILITTKKNSGLGFSFGGEEEMGKFNTYMKTVMLNEPVLVISAIVGSIGLILPLVVPPIRNAMSKSDQPPPPNLKNVVSGMTGKQVEQ